MHEHRPRLIQAFSDAKKQLIIISPWLRDAAIDSELLTALDGALKRGVDVLIGYGLGDDWKNDRSIRALRRLGSTKKKGRNNKNGKLQLRTFKDVHSKVLICDDEYMIISSFNWLSFGGNLKRGSRVEDGIVVRDKDAIYKKKQEWLDRLTG
jgi:phosphatidylserine/phosphatidylglycerophosphate/cardiolipin synthase-like enzyme